MQSDTQNHRMSRWGWLLALSVLAWNLIGSGVTPVQAYEQLGPNTRSDFRLWTPVYLTVKLPSKFIAYMEVNPRIGDDVTNIDQLLLRPAIGYQLTEHLSIWQGYAWVGNFNQPHTPPQSPFFEENRIYQQVNYNHKFSHFKFLLRSQQLRQRLSVRSAIQQGLFTPVCCSSYRLLSKPHQVGRAVDRACRRHCCTVPPNAARGFPDSTSP